MEWVETTGRTIPEALETALDQLGVDADDAEYEVLEDAKPGLFGKVRVEARLRARVRPVPQRAKEPRKTKRGAAVEAGKSPVVAVEAEVPKAKAKSRKREKAPVSETAGAEPSPAFEAEPLPQGELSDDLTAAVEVAKDFLGGLVEVLGLGVSFEVHGIDERTVQVGILGDQLGVLVGQGAKTLEALQELARTIVHYELGERGLRLMLDVAGYRAKRRTALEQYTRKISAEVLQTGRAKSLEPMGAVDRKVIHDEINRIDGVVSSSDGEEPNRYVVIRGE